MDIAEKERLISHAVSSKNIEDVINSIAQRIKEEGDKPYVTAEKQLQLLAQLTEFELGIFSLKNRGLNGFWTHYTLTYPWYKEENHRLKPLEQFLLERAPIVLATQQRFGFFLRENQKQVQNNQRLACIPGGLMGELLYLNYKGIENIELYGIDYDIDALNDAKALAEKLGLSHFTHFIQSDAWQLIHQNDFDLISSNGLNVYEPDNEKVIDLYRRFYQALRPNGKLVTSFLTFPPNFPDKCEWKMEKVNQEDLLLQKIVFVDIIGAKWQCFRTTEQTRKQLESVGFRNVQFILDDANIFPTVVAEKL